MTRFVFLLVLSLLLSGCGRNMYDQPKYEMYESSFFLPDNTSAQPIPAGTVSQKRGGVDPSYLTGQGPEGLLTELPIPLTPEVLERGQERYNIYCSPCHNFSGNGHGIIVQKGFVQPASFHEPRLRNAPVGYFYNAITYGFGRMYSYAARVPPEDRWAISAYIKSLQLSQYAAQTDVPEALRDGLFASVEVGEGLEAPATDTVEDTVREEAAQGEGGRAETAEDEAPLVEVTQDEPQGGLGQDDTVQDEEAVETADVEATETEEAEEVAEAVQGTETAEVEETGVTEVTQDTEAEEVAQDAEPAVAGVDSEALYTANCASCHQGNGEGIPGAFPPLAGHMPVLYNAEGGRDYLINVLLYGLQGEIVVEGQTYNGLMPAWATLSDAEIAGILNHEMTSWGNEAEIEGFEPYTPEDIAAFRGQELSAGDVYEIRQDLALEEVSP